MAGLYGYAWQKRRVAHLRRDPLCAICRQLGRARPATIADHIIPHRGNPDLFAGEIQSLCKPCHDSIKRQLENSGTFRGCDAEGKPLDPGHWWKQ